MSGPDGFDLSRMAKEEADIAAFHEQCAAELREMGVPVPDPYTEAQICQLVRDHNPPTAARVPRVQSSQ